MSSHPKNVRITDNGIVHKKRFAWLTACGKTFGKQFEPVVHGFAGDTEDAVTCVTCEIAKPQDHNLEFGYLGVSVTCVHRVPDDIDWIRNLYRIEVVIPPFVKDNGLSMTAHLPSDEHALSMAQMIASWYMHAACGELFELVPPPADELEAEAV